MKHLIKYLPKPLHRKRLSNSTAAIAGFASALSVIIGMLAARAAPRGWHRVSIALHFGKAPLLVKLAPFIAGVAVTVATAAGLVRFYAWCLEKAEEEREDAEHKND